MKTLKVFFNGSEEEFLNDCKAKKISTKTVKKGKGEKRCFGPYTYRWIKMYGTDYEAYEKILEEYGSLTVFFDNTVDRAMFVKKFERKYKTYSYDTNTLWNYYGMESIYEVRIKKS